MLAYLIRKARGVLSPNFSYDFKNTAPFDAMGYLKQAKNELNKINDSKNRNELDRVTGLSLIMHGKDDIAGYNVAIEISKGIAQSIRNELLTLHVKNLSELRNYNNAFVAEEDDIKLIDRRKFNVSNKPSFERNVLTPYSEAFYYEFHFVEGYNKIMIF